MTRSRWVSAGLSYKHPEHLIMDQWSIKTNFYLVYRWLSCIYLSTWLIASIAEFTPPKSKYFLNVTSWSFIILTSAATFRAVLATKFIQNGSPLIRMTCALRLIWVLENVSAVMALGVTIGYWSILNKDGKLSITAVTVHTHGVNGLYVVIDLLLTARPCHFLHFWHAMTFALVYLIFSVIYWAADGTGPHNQPYIYPALDWRNPTRTLIFSFLFGVVLTVVTHVFLYFIYRIRMWIHKQFIIRYSNSSSPEIPDEEKELQDVCAA